MKSQIVKILSHLSPRMMSNLAYKVLTNPQVKKLRAHESVMLDKAKKAKIKFGEFDIQTYEWGNSKHEKILLIHGWEGQAGNFTDLIKGLLDKEYHVIAFDGPSHGFSSRGSTSLFEFSGLIGTMIKKYQSKKLVSHSFGGVATTFALFNNQDIEIDKYVLLTTPDKFTQRINDVANFVGITEQVKQLLIDRLEEEMDGEVQDFNVSDFVKEIRVEQSLIIHDKNDKVIPIAQSQNVCDNWKNCQIKVIEGTGHFRILRTNTVIDQVIAFMN